MINIHVTAETPLMKNGMEIFVVLDRAGAIHGAYPSLKRAMQYIGSWLKTDSSHPILSVEQFEKTWKVKVSWDMRNGDPTDPMHEFTVLMIEFLL